MPSRSRSPSIAPAVVIAVSGEVSCGSTSARRQLLREAAGREVSRVLGAAKPASIQTPRPASSSPSSCQPSSPTLSETQSGSSLQPRTCASRWPTSPPVTHSPVVSDSSTSGAASRSAATVASTAAGARLSRPSSPRGWTCSAFAPASTDRAGVARQLGGRQGQRVVLAGRARAVEARLEEHVSCRRRRTRRSTCRSATRPAPCRRCRRRRRAAAARAGRGLPGERAQRAGEAACRGEAGCRA